ncbi:MAG: MYXO-CTERM sorting domain-containing protein [Polyangia bacterium]
MLLTLGALVGGAAGLSCQPEAPPASPAAGVAPAAKPASLPPELRAAMLSARQREAGPEYQFKAAAPGADAVFTADNAEQELALRVSPEGAQLSVRGGALTLRLLDYGCEGKVASPGPATLRRSDEQNRIELARAELTEWYVNGPLGIEQGFTIPEPPTARGCGREQRLQLGIALAGHSGLAEEHGAGSSYVALSVGGQRLAYTDVFAADRTGRALPAELHVEREGGERIVLRVDTRDAAFPIRIYPLVRAFDKQRLSTYDLIDDRLGSAVAISGDLAVIGAPEADPRDRTRTGAAYIFWRSSFGGSWYYRQKLTAADGAAGDRFGSTVGIAVDTVIVGAPGADVAGKADAGAAYVFTGSGTSWSLQKKLVASDAAAGDGFGGAVAYGADTATVGAPGADLGAKADAGAAYVFTRSAGAWSEQAKLTASDASDGDAFGSAVAQGLDNLVVGAPRADATGKADAGAAYVFIRSAGAWSEQGKLTATDAAAGDALGTAVGLSGDLAAAGAPGADLAGKADAGAGYVFVRIGVAWSQQQKLVASDGSTGDRFGLTLSLSGYTVAVGAPNAAPLARAGLGAAYLYFRSAGTWSEQAKLFSGDGSPDDHYGSAVAISSDSVIIGAPGFNVGSMTDAGAFYTARRSGTTWTAEPRRVAPDNGNSYYFGKSVALSSDTAIVGAPFARAAYVFVRSGAAWVEQAKIASPDTAGDSFGNTVALSGDTALIGAPEAKIGMISYAGAVYVFTRSGTSWQQQARLTASDAKGNTYFANALGLSGDTALVGAGAADTPGKSGSGAVYVFTRSGTTWSEQKKLAASDALTGGRFGESVALVGDTALVGSPGAAPGGLASAGAAYVFVRSGAAWSEQKKFVASDAAKTDEFGTAVALSGDSALVGAPRATHGGKNEAGAGYAFARVGTAWNEQAKLTASDAGSDQLFGISVALDQDTAILGAPYTIPTAGDRLGAAYVFGRTGTTWSERKRLEATATTTDGNQFGTAMAVLGDTALIGAYFTNVESRPYAGSVHVYTGLLKNVNGATCALADECESGFCVDGVCCNSACGGGVDSDCQACSDAKKESAGTAGICGAAKRTQVCRTATGACDKAETCDGTNLACPADALVPGGTRCRASSGPCDPEEQCSGTGADCPADALAAPGTTCRAAAGPCDTAEACSGTSAACPADALAASGTTCRAAASPCDVAETCSGTSATCPSDGYATAGTVCRAAAGDCDVAEKCSGFSGTCPSDSFASAATVCRSATGICDVAERCTGGAAACPADTLAAPGTLCRAATGACDAPEACTGTSNACPADALAAPGTVCRAANGVCDVAETCSGTSNACPTDSFAPPTTVCRSASGACDKAETCSGTSGSCPTDSFAPAGTECRAAAGPCDKAESCTGMSSSCPTDSFMSPGTACRPASGECDSAESCSGTTASCPADTAQPDGTRCSGGMCSAGMCKAAVADMSMAPADMTSAPADQGGPSAPDLGGATGADLGTGMDKGGCSCSVPGSARTSASPPPLALLGLGVALLRIRRRARAA